jgi:hypothetical protein
MKYIAIATKKDSGIIIIKGTFLKGWVVLLNQFVRKLTPRSFGSMS